jgi:hypothetical protein
MLCYLLLLLFLSCCGSSELSLHIRWVVLFTFFLLSLLWLSWLESFKDEMSWTGQRIDFEMWPSRNSVQSEGGIS